MGTAPPPSIVDMNWDMNWQIDRLLYKREKTWGEKILLSPLTFASLPYGLAIRLRILSYNLGFRRQASLPCPVISVGNITVGGTGKTPLVITLAKGLLEKGIPLAILSRGYRGKASSEPVVSDGKKKLLSPEESGDEPFLMAQRLPEVPILVGKDRFRTGHMAFERFGVQGILLDDGFQYLRLHRDLDIVLVDSSLGFGDHHLLPRGILREPLSHLRRAHLFLLTKVEDVEACRPLEKRLREIHPSSPIFHSHYEPVGLIGPRGEWEDPPALKGKKVIALSGIGNPAYFSTLLKKMGAEVIREIIYPDHHTYTTQDLTFLEKNMSGIDRIVATEKDMVKLNDLHLDPFPVRSLRIELRIWEREEFFQRVVDVFAQKGGRPIERTR